MLQDSQTATASKAIVERCLSQRLVEREASLRRANEVISICKLHDAKGHQPMLRDRKAI